ncbi:uncharacterized protein L199_005104 [Kwoniella botswanensis]|uniref:uncharacterized protein n=1 Tax=Kwoniella botswanensis TaxID=1268659 RepID=UPI00315D239D
MAISATLKPTTILDELSNLWCQANDQTEIPLVTLILGIHHSRTYSTAANLSVTRSTTEEGAMHVMPTIGRLFPKLHNLFITSFTGDRYFFCDIPFTIEDPLKIPVKSNDPDVDFVGYLSNLRFSTNLRYLDCGISFLPGANPPVTPDARASVSKKVFIDQLRSFDKASDEYQEHLRKFRNRLRDLIGIVLLHLPSLQGGAFWEPTVGDTYPESWLRWSWSIEAETETPKDDSDAHGKRRKDGGSCVVVDTKPICFNYPFMLARNGDSIPSSPSRSFLTNTQGVEEGKKQDRDGDISRWEEDDNW